MKTETASMQVLASQQAPQTGERISIPESELTYRHSRSSGPGGQNVNKVNSRVELLFDYLGSRVLSWEQKGRLVRHPEIARRLNSDGLIHLFEDGSRSQLENRSRARERLEDLVNDALMPRKERLEVETPASLVFKRKKDKSYHSAKKRGRRWKTMKW